jgi:hypothetical protein
MMTFNISQIALYQAAKKYLTEHFHKSGLSALMA